MSSHNLCSKAKMADPQRCELLLVPREIRDLIYEQIFTRHGLLHVTAVYRIAADITFGFHACSSPDPLSTTASPIGIGDHTDCQSSDSSDRKKISEVNLAILASCKQINAELKEGSWMRRFFAENAFQFNELQEAGRFLFGIGNRFHITEDQRASIQHLRFALPFYLTRMDSSSAVQSWKSINNYFSIPWVRNTLQIPDESGFSSDITNVRRKFYFVKSLPSGRCGIWCAKLEEVMTSGEFSVIRGDTTRRGFGHRTLLGHAGHIMWNVNCEGLRMKKRPKIELAMECPHQSQLTDAYDSRLSFDLTRIQDSEKWLKPLLQFRQYGDLELTFYDRDGILNDDILVRYADALKSKVAEPLIGPQKCVFFKE